MTQHAQGLREAITSRGTREGEIWNRRKNGEIFPEVLVITAIRDDHGVVTHYIGIFRDIILRKERETRLQHLSHHDPLTDLPNRALFLDRLDHSIRRARRLEQQIALLFIDLDNFKAVNDTAGHLAGDHALQVVATRLVSVVRDMDTVARVGGDEFAILLSDIAARDQVTALAARILEVLSRPVELSGRAYACRCSIGMSLGPHSIRLDAECPGDRLGWHRRVGSGRSGVPGEPDRIYFEPAGRWLTAAHLLPPAGSHGLLATRAGCCCRGASVRCRGDERRALRHEGRLPRLSAGQWRVTCFCCRRSSRRRR